MSNNRKAADPVVPNIVGEAQAVRSRRRMNTASVVHDNSEQKDDMPITARFQRRRRIAEGKRDNFPVTIILESQPQETIAAADVVVPNDVVAVEAKRRNVRMNTLSEGKRHVDSDSDDDDVPMTTTLSKPPKELPTPVIPKGNDALVVTPAGTAQYPWVLRQSGTTDGYCRVLPGTTGTAGYCGYCGYCTG